MGRTLNENIAYLKDTIKPAIKQAIIDKGVAVSDSDSFLDYADRIAEIEGGTEIDTSKVGYQIGTGFIGLYEGRILKGFASMDSRSAFVVNGLNNSDIGVPWSDSFEIGARFKLTAYPSSSAFQFIFGNGANGVSYRFYCPSLYIDGSNHKMGLQVGASSSSWLVTEAIDYTIDLDTWYFVKLKFVKSTMKLTLDISTDMSTYTNLYDNTLSQAPFYDSSNSYLAIGGDCRQSERTTNTFLIDTFNTYIKDSTGSIVWGCFKGD